MWSGVELLRGKCTSEKFQFFKKKRKNSHLKNIGEKFSKPKKKCEFCNKKLFDGKNAHKWTDYNVSQHRKFCKLRPVEISNYISKFFGTYIFLIIQKLW